MGRGIFMLQRGFNAYCYAQRVREQRVALSVLVVILLAGVAFFYCNRVPAQQKPGSPTMSVSIRDGKLVVLCSDSVQRTIDADELAMLDKPQCKLLRYKGQADWEPAPSQLPDPSELSGKAVGNVFTSNEIWEVIEIAPKEWVDMAAQRRHWGKEGLRAFWDQCYDTQTQLLRIPVN